MLDICACEENHLSSLGDEGLAGEGHGKEEEHLWRNIFKKIIFSKIIVLKVIFSNIICNLNDNILRDMARKKSIWG